MRKLWYNGKVWTGTGKKADAFLTENGSFVWVGKLENLPEDVENVSEKTDLGGNFVCPGFNDSHMHLLNYGRTLQMASLMDHTSSPGDVQECLRDFIRQKEEAGELQEDSWVLGRGWNQDFFEGEKRFLTRKDLDEVTETYPVCIIRACGHCCVVNSRALETLGITKDTPQPEGGCFDTDEDGEPNGILREHAVEYVTERIPAPDRSGIRSMLIQAMRKLNSYGITSCQTDDFTVFDVPYQQILDIFPELEREGKLTVRIQEQAQFRSREELEEFLGFGERPAGGFFRVGPLKIVGDGSLGSRTAYLGRPYSDAPDTRGMTLLSQEELEELVFAAHRHGMSTAIHAIGDGFLDQALDALERAQKEAPGKDCRHGIVHCQITRPEQLERMAALGLHVYAQSIFLDYDIRIVESRVGRELAKSSYAFRSLLERGISVSNGSDCPVESPDVLAGIQCAVTRKTLDGSAGPYREEEAVSVEEALASYTSQGAYASFEEKEKGKIREGMKADFVILKEDPAAVLKEEIGRIPVLETWLDGRCVFRAEGFDRRQDTAYSINEIQTQEAGFRPKRGRVR